MRGLPSGCHVEDQGLNPHDINSSKRRVGKERRRLQGDGLGNLLQRTVLQSEVEGDCLRVSEVRICVTIRDQ